MKNVMMEILEMVMDVLLNVKLKLVLVVVKCKIRILLVMNVLDVFKIVQYVIIQLLLDVNYVIKDTI
jgi:hypothetical protein